MTSRPGWRRPRQAARPRPFVLPSRRLSARPDLAVLLAVLDGLRRLAVA